MFVSFVLVFSTLFSLSVAFQATQFADHKEQLLANQARFFHINGVKRVGAHGSPTLKMKSGNYILANYFSGDKCDEDNKFEVAQFSGECITVNTGNSYRYSCDSSKKNFLTRISLALIHLFSFRSLRRIFLCKLCRFQQIRGLLCRC
jgi:hypothetical protein